MTWRSACVLLVVASAALARAQSTPLVELTDDGRAFVYRTRPGDTPTGIAHAFGIPDAEVPGWIAAHGVRDGTRVPLGFAWRVPNPLAARDQALAARVDALSSQLAAAAARADAADRAAATARDALAAATARGARAETLAHRWALAQVAVLVLVAGLAAALASMVTARRSAERAVRWARGLAAELEEKRKAILLERQQTARRLVELEDRIRRLEAPSPPAPPGSRVRVVGRTG